MRNVSAVRVLALLLPVVLLILAGCTQTFPKDLQSLQSDPMASPDLPGTELVRRSETQAEVGMMHKPGMAMIQLTFRPVERDVESVKAEAVEQAAQAGWKLDDRHEEVVRGNKRLDTGDASLGISILNTDEGERLLIILTHEFNHPTH